MQQVALPAVFGALADPTRLAIVERLLARGRAVGGRYRRPLRDQQAGHLQAPSRPRGGRADRAADRSAVAGLPRPARGDPRRRRMDRTLPRLLGRARSTAWRKLFDTARNGRTRPWLTPRTSTAPPRPRKPAPPSARWSSSGSSRRARRGCSRRGPTRRSSSLVGAGRLRDAGLQDGCPPGRRLADDHARAGRQPPYRLRGLPRDLAAAAAW